MVYKKMLLACVSSVLVSSALCVSGKAQAEETQQQEPVKTARIRLFSQNGSGMWFYRNQACYQLGFFSPPNAEVVSTLGAALSSFIGTISNTRIGMPESPTTKRLSERHGLASKAFFKEYHIDAGQPLTVMMTSGAGPGYECPLSAYSFIPKAGKEYEAFLDVDEEKKRCHYQIREIVASQDSTELQPVEDVKPVDVCKPSSAMRTGEAEVPALLSRPRETAARSGASVARAGSDAGDGYRCAGARPG
ncbi:hypothetical protein GCM10011289_09490 [Paludibacterium paludis]|uniref:Uncharacterized protein n=2 Tax=Paludibacterium paludis TaxID=1225769 RepID=A0A918P0S4_9NEIS|nr:hypothetical protein [Paludibacterium paludis]GGY08928.1 hypothetical protein GCM10011289_09490 [Paludibacterium paludis]